MCTDPDADGDDLVSLGGELVPPPPLRGDKARPSSSPFAGLEVAHDRRESVLVDSLSMLPWVRDDDYGTIGSYAKGSKRYSARHTVSPLTEDVTASVGQAQFKGTAGRGTAADHGLQASGADGQFKQALVVECANGAGPPFGSDSSRELNVEAGTAREEIEKVRCHRPLKRWHTVRMGVPKLRHRGLEISAKPRCKLCR